ncbi:MAG: hypothetical protein ACRDIB_07275, partial [Ardenticatenaceae bacterium]
QGECRDDGAINCNLGNIDSGARATVEVTITASAVGELVINPFTKSSNLDSNTENNQFTSNISVTSPTIGLSSTSFSFTSVTGNPNPRPQALHIANVGDGRLNWFVSSVCSATLQQADLAEWLRITPSQGNIADEPQTVTLQPVIAGLEERTHRTSFFITSAGATNDCQLVSVELTVLSPVGRPQQSAVNLQKWEAQGLAEAVRQFLDAEKTNVTDQAQQRWFDIGETLAEALEADSTSLRPLSNPARSVRTASSELAAVGSVFGNWGPNNGLPLNLGETTLEFARTISEVLSGRQPWQSLGIVRVDSAGTDSLYVAYDRAEGKALVHLDVFNPSAPGQIDAVIPIAVGEDGSSLVLGGDEESVVFARRVPMVMVNLQSPGELRVFDQIGRLSGVINGSTVEIIPSSVFAGETVSILLASEAQAQMLRYEITGTEQGAYGLD